MSRLCGLDGCKGGWVVLSHETESDLLTIKVLKTGEIPALNFHYAAIDIPIGLTDSGPRECDKEARRYLRPKRSSSVFPAPIRPAVTMKTRLDACAVTERIDGKLVSPFSFGIYPKVAEIDALFTSNKPLAGKLFEVHPEVSFAAWAGAPLEFGKKSRDGKMLRQSLIARTFGEGVFDALYKQVWGKGVAADDIADAFAALWTAHRRHYGEAQHFPGYDCYDSTGLPMNIWY